MIAKPLPPRPSLFLLLPATKLEQDKIHFNNANLVEEPSSEHFFGTAHVLKPTSAFGIL